MGEDGQNTSKCRPDIRPSFLITIDTEGDNLWSAPATITTHNATALPRFQALCQSYGLKPTYLTNFEMAMCPDFQEFGRDLLKRGAGEIGMHLHAWNSPPLVPLTSDDHAHHPYLIEYPTPVIRDKIRFLTDLLEDTFGVKMKSQRAGKWSFNAVYAQILLEAGYSVDCSVTPHVSWKHALGDPQQSGGTDYTSFPETAYFMDLADISKPGRSSLLEVPTTIVRERNEIGVIERLRSYLKDRSQLERVFNRFFPRAHWLRPNGRNLKAMLNILTQARQEKRAYVEFMLHSSEFLPGGSPKFRHQKDIEALYDTLEALFSTASQTFKGATLTDYYEEFCGQPDHTGGSISPPPPRDYQSPHQRHYDPLSGKHASTHPR